MVANEIDSGRGGLLHDSKVDKLIAKAICAIFRCVLKATS